ncbi:hypothetical protein OG883_14045 [Streptomyces sp. NBC_01142]|uniref:hypothetical protein n=1 Tax=Streptomyces sp. NBC_01142 TaxID=2975865 RepID=UPI002257B93C|nr:hypothetical protein [Streptomyces sp. NBC_01142]MCX4821014.1 hypothetical protein [Streptomyces sp. NBC_01142]
MTQSFCTDVDSGDYEYVFLGWFIASISMIGGAFGTGLEECTAVHNAAYGRRHRDRQQRLRDTSGATEDGKRTDRSAADD